MLFFRGLGRWVNPEVFIKVMGGCIFVGLIMAIAVFSSVIVLIAMMVIEHPMHAFVMWTEFDIFITTVTMLWVIIMIVMMVHSFGRVILEMLLNLTLCFLFSACSVKCRLHDVSMRCRFRSLHIGLLVLSV